MTKDQEMAVIDRAAAELGRDSYLGPWLLSVRAELAGAIRSDLFPTPMLPNEAHREAEGVRQRAQAAADAVAESADRKARATIEQAHKEAAEIRARLAGDLRQEFKRLTGQAW